MRRQCGRLAHIAFLGLWPQPASAHGMLQGFGDFTGGLLHPLVVPSEVMLLAAAGLSLGTSGVAACRWGLAAFAAGTAGGLALAPFLPNGVQATVLLLSATVIMAAIVAAGVQLARTYTPAFATPCGLALGLDATPEAGISASMLAAAAGTLIAAVLAVLLISALALACEAPWQRIVARIAGSWLAASAVLYLAWLLAAPAG